MVRSALVIRRCDFFSNIAPAGGAISVITDDVSFEVVDSRFVRNVASTTGGGINNPHSGTLIVSGSFFCENMPDHIFGGWIDQGGNDFSGDCCSGADLTDDGKVGVSDLLVLFAVWGTPGPFGDINKDGIVDVADMLIMFANWGPCP